MEKKKKVPPLQAASTMGPTPNGLASPTTTTTATPTTTTTNQPTASQPVSGIKSPQSNGIIKPSQSTNTPRTPSPPSKTRPLITSTPPYNPINAGIGSRPAAPSISTSPFPSSSPSTSGSRPIQPLSPTNENGLGPSQPPPLPPSVGTTKRIIPGGSSRLPPPLPNNLGATSVKKTPGRGTNLP